MRPCLCAVLAGTLTAAAGAEMPPLVLTWEQAVAAALEASPDLKTLAIERNAAVAVAGWGWRDYLPKLGLNYAQNETVQFDAPDTRSIQAGVTVTQLLFDAGRGGRRKELSRLQLLINRHDAQVQEEKVTDTVTAVFNQILVLKTKREIQTRAVELGQRQLAISRTEWALGSAREIDVLATEAQVSGLLVGQKQGDRALRDALFRLANLIGLDPAVPLDVDGSFDADYPGLAVPESGERWLALVLDSSKDLALQRLELRKQYFAVVESRLWFAPDVSVQTSASLTGARFPLQTPAYNATVTFSFPNEAFPFIQTVAAGATPGQSATSAASSSVGVLDSVRGFVEGNLAEAQLRVTQLRETVLTADTRLMFEKTLADYRLLVEKLALQRQTVTLEDRKSAILAKQVELGEAKRVDYLQGETQLAADRMALVESVLQVKESERALERLLHRTPGTLAQAVAEARR